MWTYRHSPSTWNTVCVCGVIFLYLCVYMCVRACGVISLCCICVCACAHTDYLRKCSVCIFVRTLVRMYVCVYFTFFYVYTWVNRYMDVLTLATETGQLLLLLEKLCHVYAWISPFVHCVCVFVRARKREREERENELLRTNVFSSKCAFFHDWVRFVLKRASEVRALWRLFR